MKKTEPKPKKLTQRERLRRLEIKIAKLEARSAIYEKLLWVVTSVVAIQIASRIWELL